MLCVYLCVMGKTSKSFRLPEESAKQLKTISDLLKESETDIVIRAIERLYEDREAILEQDIAKRRENAKAK